MTTAICIHKHTALNTIPESQKIAIERDNVKKLADIAKMYDLPTIKFYAKEYHRLAINYWTQRVLEGTIEINEIPQLLRVYSKY